MDSPSPATSYDSRYQIFGPARVEFRYQDS